MQRSRHNVYGERKTRVVCHCHELRPLAPLGVSDTGAPLFRHHKGRVDKTFVEIELASIFQILGKRFEDPSQYSRAYPFLETPMASLSWWKLLRHILPTCSGAEDPENTVDDFSIRSSWSSFAIGSDFLYRYERLYMGLYIPAMGASTVIKNPNLYLDHLSGDRS